MKDPKERRFISNKRHVETASRIFRVRPSNGRHRSIYAEIKLYPDRIERVVKVESKSLQKRLGITRKCSLEDKPYPTDLGLIEIETRDELDKIMSQNSVPGQRSSKRMKKGEVKVESNGIGLVGVIQKFGHQEIKHGDAQGKTQFC